MADPKAELADALEQAGLLQDEYPDQMAQRSCTCEPEAMCGAHRLLARYDELFETFQRSNSEKREAKAQVRALRAENEAQAAVIASAAETPDVIEALSVWPEWLTSEYSAIHTAIENEMKRALEHCYRSADADGRDWTTAGWISCSASNVISMLRRLGSPPPAVGEVERLPMPEGPDFDEEEFFADERERMEPTVRKIVASATICAPHDKAAINMLIQRACDDLMRVVVRGEVKP